MKWWFVVTLGWLVGCAGAVDDPGEAGSSYEEHAEVTDFEPAPDVPSDGKADVVPAAFDKNFIVTDEFYRDSTALDASQVQALLERTPYGRASWLAWESIGNRRVSDVIVEVSARHNLNPLMILTRFQVEGSHMSRTARPGQRSRDRALGCGCFDGQSCQRQYAGLENQIECAADVLDRRYQGSVDGSWTFAKGRTKRTLDPISVTPINHATAALYSYTPWVLVGRGGNWLVWNVTKKFVSHIRTSGFDNFGDGTGTPPPVDAFVGTVCVEDDDCDFSDGDNPALCYDFADAVTGQSRGFCTVVCEGFCPDKRGHATTFCVEADVGGVGVCMAKSASENNNCTSIPGTSEQERERWVGSSGVSAASAYVCAP